MGYAEWRLHRRRGGLKAGLILIAIGAGISLFNRHDNLFAGAIPAFIGAALVINSVIERLWSRDPSAREPRA